MTQFHLKNMPAQALHDIVAEFPQQAQYTDPVTMEHDNKTAAIEYLYVGQWETSFSKWSYVTASPSHHDQANPILFPSLSHTLAIPIIERIFVISHFK